jgi:hypothetical protein
MARPPVELPDIPERRPEPQAPELPDQDLPEDAPPPDEGPDVGPLEIPFGDGEDVG